MPTAAAADAPIYIASGSSSLRVWQVNVSSGQHHHYSVAVPPNKAQLLDVTWTGSGNLVAAVTPSAVLVYEKTGTLRSVIAAGSQEELRAVAAGYVSSRRLYYGGTGQVVR